MPCIVAILVTIACISPTSVDSPEVRGHTVSSSDPEDSPPLSNDELDRQENDQKTCNLQGSDNDDLVFRNFMLEPYAPLRSRAHEHKDVEPMGSFGLWQELMAASSSREVLSQLSLALRRRFGTYSTVWAMKAVVPPLASSDDQMEAQLEWEFYWVLDGDASGVTLPSDVAAEIAPWLDMYSSGCDIDLLDKMALRRSLTMFSIDVSPQALHTGTIKAVNVYLEDPLPLNPAQGTAHTRSRVFSCSDSGFVFKNAYVAYEIKHEKAIAKRVVSSPHFPHSAKDSYVACALHRTELMEDPVTHRPFFIHLASKPERDGIYYSGASIEQLITFLRTGPHGRCSRVELGFGTGEQNESQVASFNAYKEQTWGWPNDVLNVLEKFQPNLHLLRFDAGFDFVVEEKSGHRRVRFLRTAFYGTF